MTTAIQTKPHALYRFYDRHGALLYVGITATLPERLKAHRDEKPWWCDVADIKVEHFPDRRSVIEAEKKAIRTENPRHNVQHNGARTGQTFTETGAPARFGIEVGFVVALMTDLPTRTKCYVGEVQAIDDVGVRITLIDWFIGMFTNEDLFVPWPHVIGAAVWTEAHSIIGGALERWQNEFHGKHGKREDSDA